MDPNDWTLELAVTLCRRIEEIAPRYGAHVALTGGVLYKDGPRKDLDLLFYRVRQAPSIDRDGLFIELSRLGVVILRGWSWVFKASVDGRAVDIFFPEEAAVLKSDPASGEAPPPPANVSDGK